MNTQFPGAKSQEVQYPLAGKMADVADDGRAKTQSDSRATAHTDLNGLRDVTILGKIQGLCRKISEGVSKISEGTSQCLSKIGETFSKGKQSIQNHKMTTLNPSRRNDISDELRAEKDIKKCDKLAREKISSPPPSQKLDVHRSRVNDKADSSLQINKIARKEKTIVHKEKLPVENDKEAFIRLEKVIDGIPGASFSIIYSEDKKAQVIFNNVEKEYQSKLKENLQKALIMYSPNDEYKNLEFNGNIKSDMLFSIFGFPKETGFKNEQKFKDMVARISQCIQANGRIHKEIDNFIKEIEAYGESFPENKDKIDEIYKELESIKEKSAMESPDKFPQLSHEKLRFAKLKSPSPPPTADITKGAAEVPTNTIEKLVAENESLHVQINDLIRKNKESVKEFPQMKQKTKDKINEICERLEFIKIEPGLNFPSPKIKAKTSRFSELQKELQELFIEESIESTKTQCETTKIQLMQKMQNPTTDINERRYYLNFYNELMTLNVKMEEAPVSDKKQISQQILELITEIKTLIR